MAERVRMHVAEWKALLDALQQDERWAAGPFGWWGVSMGTFHGIPLAAADDRIAAAVFGLNALRPGADEMAANAAAITIRTRFSNHSEPQPNTPAPPPAPGG